MKTFYDSFSGLVPCKVQTAFSDRGTRIVHAIATVTAKRGPYAKGESIDVHAYRVVESTGITTCRSLFLDEMLKF